MNKKVQHFKLQSLTSEAKWFEASCEDLWFPSTACFWLGAEVCTSSRKLGFDLWSFFTFEICTLVPFQKRQRLVVCLFYFAQIGQIRHHWLSSRAERTTWFDVGLFLASKPANFDFRVYFFFVGNKCYQEIKSCWFWIFLVFWFSFFSGSGACGSWFALKELTGNRCRMISHTEKGQAGLKFLLANTNARQILDKS